MNEAKGMKPLDEGRLRRLLREQRWACLGTLDEGKPFVSWVAYVVDEEGSLLLHLSRLAKHTRNLLTDGAASPTISLAISETDDDRSDPQTLARITLDGVVEVVARDSAAYQAGRECYLARLPDAAMLFDFEDFSLFKLTPQAARYVEGFGSTHRLNGERLQQLLASS
jgi:hypothetical protein